MLTQIVGFSPVQVSAAESKTIKSGSPVVNLLNEPSKPAISSGQILVTIYAKSRSESDNYIFAYAAVDKGATVEEAGLPVPEKEGYVFNEWWDQKGNVYDESDTIDADLTLYPSFTKASKVTITFDYGIGTHNGKSIETYTMEVGHSLKYAMQQVGLLSSVPVQKFYAFSGWRLGTQFYSAESDFFDEFIPDISVTAYAGFNLLFTTFRLVSPDGLEIYGSLSRCDTVRVGESISFLLDGGRGGNLISEVPHVEYATWTYLDGNKKGRAVEDTDVVGDLGASVIRVYPEYEKVPVTVNTGIYADGAAAGSRYRANNPDTVTFKTYYVPANTKVDEMWDYFELPRSEYINKYLSKSGYTFDGWLTHTGTRLKDSDDIYEGMVLMASYSSSSGSGSDYTRKSTFSPESYVDIDYIRKMYGDKIENEADAVTEWLLNCSSLGWNPSASTNLRDCQAFIEKEYGIHIEDYVDVLAYCAEHDLIGSAKNGKVPSTGGTNVVYVPVKPTTGESTVIDNLDEIGGMHPYCRCVICGAYTEPNDWALHMHAGNSVQISAPGYKSGFYQEYNRCVYDSSGKLIFEKKVYACGECGHMFSSLENATAHVKSHWDGSAVLKDDADIDNDPQGGSGATPDPASDGIPDVTQTSVNETSYNAIYWAVDKGIVKGYSDGLFKPEVICSREQFSIMLWRFAGQPAADAGAANKFSDVSSFSNSTSKKAVGWAVKQGIVKGFSDGSFKPKESITRAQVAVMLWRYAGEPKADGSSKFSDIGPFSANVQKAIIWLEANRIASGYKDGTFRPDDGCQRQHMAIFLYRYSSNIE